MEIKIDESIRVQTSYGQAEVISFSGLTDNKEHIILAFGDWRSSNIPKVRIHSECLTGDVFGSKRCDCGPQLHEAMKNFSETSGIIVYLRQEGRGIGLLNKLKAYRLQDLGFDTYEANRLLGFKDDQREFQVAAQMLKELGIQQICLLSNNPRKSSQLEDQGIKVSHRLFTQTYVSGYNEKYLSAKAKLGGHDGLQMHYDQGAEK